MLNSIVYLDSEITYYIYHIVFHPRILVWFFTFLSFIGTYGAIWIMIAIFRKVGIKTIVGIFTSEAVNIILKHSFQRPRPDTSMLNSFSFPSGHTMVAFTAAYILTQSISQNKKPLSRYYTITVWLLAILIGFSRVYIGEHFILDVLFGAIFGIGVGYVVNIQWNKYEQKVYKIIRC